MAFALFVCAMLLLTILYFVALVTGETTLWLVNRLIKRDLKPITLMTERR